MSACKGVFNKIYGITGMLKGSTVLATKMNGQNENSYDTGFTIDQLIQKRKLFVCDESNVTTSSTASWGDDRTDAKYMSLGHGGGGKRNKSRKPKRRNSRSNRTLNKSKK